MADSYGFHVGKYAIHMDPSWDRVPKLASIGET